jgi:hypothetical protein
MVAKWLLEEVIHLGFGHCTSDFILFIRKLPLDFNVQ